MFRTCFVALLVAVVVVGLAGCSGPSMSLSSTTVERGGQINVKWSAPGSYKDNAWIGIIPSNIPHGSEATNDEHDVTYQYLGGKSSGMFTFTVPKKKGSWDFRMHDTDDNGKEVASVTFTVQ